MKRIAVLALVSLAFAGTANAQEDDLYFETVRGARDAGCAGKKYVCYDLLSTHRRNYFLTGFTADTEVKFQFSVKYDLWPNESASSLHLAYTQKSIWNLYRVSSPFGESNYNPEIFYTYAFHAHGHAVDQTSETAPVAPVDEGHDMTVRDDVAIDNHARCTVSYARAGAGTSRMDWPAHSRVGGTESTSRR
ncbi:MAG: phospholipase A [Polyangiaceae bacterium]